MMMQVHVAGRQAGKTTNMILWLAQTPNSFVLTPDHRQVEHSVNLARDMGFGEVVDPDRFVVPSQLDRLRARGRPALGIDNLDMLVPSLIGSTFGAVLGRVSMTGEQARTWVYTENTPLR